MLASVSVREGMFSVGLISFLSLSIAHTGTAEEFLGFYQYEDDSDVDNIAVIDLDQRTLRGRLSLETEDGFEKAKEIYFEGAYSKPSALLNLETYTSDPIAAGTAVVGITEDSQLVEATVIEDTKAGVSSLRVHYSVGSTGLCRVGGNPNPDTTGCFMSSGTVTIGTTKHKYQYDPLSDNYNDLSLSMLISKMPSCGDECSTLKKFIQYYGHGYADAWMMAAFDGTSATLENGNPDFSYFNLEGRGEAIRWGTLLLNVWVYVISRLELVLGSCNECDACKDDLLHTLDEAMAVYSGSLYTGHEGGYLIYHVAQVECEYFGTCRSVGNTADVNAGVFESFGELKHHLAEGDCEGASEHVNRIRSLMTVPIVQGVLRASYFMDKHEMHLNITQGHGAAYAAGLLPLLYDCKKGNAMSVYRDLAPGNGPTGSYEVVRFALERSYDCLGITCEDVGGLLEYKGAVAYHAGAAPCGSESGSGSESESDKIDNAVQIPKLKVINSAPRLGLVISLPVVFGILLVIIVYSSRRKGRKENAPVQEPAEPDVNVKPIV